MKKRFEIKIGDCRYRIISFDFSLRSTIIYDIENICLIKAHKYTNHNYTLQFFSYVTKIIFVRNNIFTQKEMYNVLQFLLQNYL